MNYSIEILPQALDNIESAYRWMADNYSVKYNRPIKKPADSELFLLQFSRISNLSV
jgi:hypothetical protein